MSGFIQIQGVKKSFRTKDGLLPVLRGIDLEVSKGDFYGIIGFSGAGKSTLARIINRLEEPDAGAVVIDGVDVGSLDKRRLNGERRKIGMIFQTFNLFDAKTVFDNIAFPLKVAKTPRGEIRDKVRRIAELCGLSDKLAAFPGALSGGQKQRVGIARALVNEPKILLSDEATSSLDPQTTFSILEFLMKINEELGLTILLITHEMDVIKYACRHTAVLEDGIILDKGATKDVFTHPKSRTGAMFLKVYSEFKEEAFEEEYNI